MKKSFEIPAHIFFWAMFILLTLTQSKLYLQADPTAPFAKHLGYVVFLELAIGLVFFYTTFICMPWSIKKKGNLGILSAVLFVLLIVFAYPATHFGLWQVLSSIIPHLLLVFLAVLFRTSFREI